VSIIWVLPTMMCGHVIIAKGGQLKFDVEQSCGRPPLLVGKTSTCRYKWRFPKSGGTMTYRWMVSWKMPSIYIWMIWRYPHDVRNHQMGHVQRDDLLSRWINVGDAKLRGAGRSLRRWEDDGWSNKKQISRSSWIIWNCRKKKTGAL